MDFNTQLNRNTLISWFPNLATDTSFSLTSPCTPIYNCIAWAMGFTDRWVDHYAAPGHWWPNGVIKNDTCQALITAFITLGFEQTDDYNYDSKYDKVVLYGHKGKWRHASKILEDNTEHSKFGEYWDGTHSFDIFQDEVYGAPYACMQRPINSFDPNKYKLNGKIKILKKPIW